MYLSLSGLGLFSMDFFRPSYDRLVCVYACVFGVELPLEFPGDSDTLIGKKRRRRRRTANQWIDLAGICVYTFVSECVICFVPYRRNYFRFSVVRQINSYLDFNLASNKFSNTSDMQILHRRCDNYITGRKILPSIKNGVNEDNPNLK